MDVIWLSEFLMIPRVLFACTLLTFSDLAVLMRLFLEIQDKECDPGGDKQPRQTAPCLMSPPNAAEELEQEGPLIYWVKAAVFVFCLDVPQLLTFLGWHQIPCWYFDGSSSWQTWMAPKAM